MFPTKEVGYVVGIGRGADTSGSLVASILRTGDGGQKWSITPQLTPSGYFQGIAELGLADAAGVLYGARVPPSAFHYGIFYDCFFINNKVGWVVGGGGVVVTTQDSGVSWNEHKLNDQITLRTVFFLDNEMGWVAGDAETIFQTTDGGQSWNQNHNGVPGLPLRQTINSLVMRSRDEGWAVGNGGLMLRTKSGGRSWELQKTLTSGHLNSIAFGDQGEGFVAGVGGELLYSDDGGLHWAIERIKQVTSAVNDIAISDKDTAWAVCGNRGGLEGEGVVIRLKRK
jgi:photosystem II stability/assembly factor-like uncharacterized protein